MVSPAPPERPACLPSRSGGPREARARRAPAEPMLARVWRRPIEGLNRESRAWPLVRQLARSRVLDLRAGCGYPLGMKRQAWVVAAVAAVLAVTAAAELHMGRLPLGPDGRFGLWEGNIWSSEQSQRLADPYSFSHIVHGFLFYGLLWLAARRLPVRVRFLMAVLLEASWEILENSPIIIDRYRSVTIALGYEGDSVLNSLSDVLMMSLGFWAAWKARVRWSVAAVLLMEVGCLLWVRDNLTLNVIMLIHPIQAIKAWQMAGAPTL